MALKDWKKLGRNGRINVYYTKNNYILAINKLDIYSWEKTDYIVLVYNKEIHSYESSLGKIIWKKYPKYGTLKSATSLAMEYMRKH